MSASLPVAWLPLRMSVRPFFPDHNALKAIPEYLNFGL